MIWAILALIGVPLWLIAIAAIDVAARPEHRAALVGPFKNQARALRPQAVEHSPLGPDSRPTPTSS